MSRYNTKTTMSRRDIAVRILIAVGCVVLAVVLLPRNASQAYSVKVNHPWYGRELVAPFEFPLLKSDEALKREQDSVRRDFSPYFREDADVKVQMLTLWRADAARRQSEGAIGKDMVAQVTRLLQDVYDRGIVEASDYDKRIRSAGAQSLGIITGKTFEVTDIERIFTPKTAYQYVVSSADSTRRGVQQMQRLDLSAYIQPNLVYDERRTATALDERLAEVLPTSGQVMRGTRIVDRGEVVTEEIALKIRSLNAEMERRDSTIGEDYMVVVGNVLYAAIVILGLVFYLVIFRFDYVASMRHVWLVAMLMVLMPVVTSLAVRTSFFNVYVIPYAMIPIMTRIFMDSRTSAMVMMASLLLCAMPLTQPYYFIFIQAVAGIVAIYSLRDLSERGQLFRCAIYVTLAALFARLALDLMDEGALMERGWAFYVSTVIGGFLLLFAYPLLFMIERTFGFTSNVTLVELSNVNNPLLRRLSEEAPGTFQHVLQVANLAAEVANAIGGKSQLVRTGALYHDIGKLKHSAFFTENQRGINPHDRLTPVQSARVIMEHVTHGLELADKANLPKVIRDFIVTHHGAGRVGYFYAKEREAHPDTEVDPTPFTYPGPNPSTMEQAILMMADAVEAASRSLREYTDESIAALVDKIVDGQVASGAFMLCPITFRDIDSAKKVFKEKLRTIYHTRISYPDLK